ncbi:MAG: hypothetical protein EWM72_00871 [Nitrospira sp.]|nr:MAG: hypothetical protein EWM72_00871 [Nitrospira sp.]
MKGTVIGSVLFMMIPVIAVASSVDLVAAKGKSFCQRVLELFQKNMGSGPRLNLDAEPFSEVKWEPAVIAGMAPKIRRCSSLDKALVDLDNDGTRDLVVKTTFCMKGAPSDSFYMFPANSNVLEQASWQDMAPLLATANKFERTGGSYPLTALPMSSEFRKGGPTLSIVFTVQPFIMDEKTYVALTDGRGKWIVIAKYLRGERFEDQCYLESNGKS